MHREKIILVGASGCGRDILWQLLESNNQVDKYDVLGFVDDDPKLKGTIINKYPVLGNIKWLMEYPKAISVLLCVGNSKIREKIYKKLATNQNISFPSFIASDAKISDSVIYGKGCIFCLSTILSVDITIGDFVIVSSDGTIGHDAVLGDFVTLYPNVNISGNVTVARRVEIGTGTNIIQGKTIGGNTIIGAGTVVVKDLPENCTAVGVPAKVLKFHEDE